MKKIEIVEKKEKPKNIPPTEEQMREFNKVWEDIDEISKYIENHQDKVSKRK
jgi:hypothetical protein